MAGGSRVRRQDPRPRRAFDPKTGSGLPQAIGHAAIAERTPIVVTTRLADGNRQIHDGDERRRSREVAEALRRGRQRRRCERRNVPARPDTRRRAVIIVGATHIAQHSGDDGDRVRIRRQSSRPANGICEPGALRSFADRRRMAGGWLREARRRSVLRRRHADARRSDR